MAKKNIGTHVDIYGNLTLQNGGTANNFRLENLAADPNTNLVEGRKYWNTASKKVRNYNGTAWEDEKGAAGGDVNSTETSSVDGQIALFSGTGGKTIKKLSDATALNVSIEGNSVLVKNGNDTKEWRLDRVLSIGALDQTGFVPGATPPSAIDGVATSSLAGFLVVFFNTNTYDYNVYKILTATTWQQIQLSTPLLLNCYYGSNQGFNYFDQANYNFKRINYLLPLDFGQQTGALTEKTTPVDADMLPIVDSAASNILKKLTFANLKVWVRGIALTGLSTATNAVINATDSILVALGKLQAQITGYAASTKTLTNTTIDANGTGNSITNLEVADFAANVIDNDPTLAANSATRIATQQAVKAYADSVYQGVKWKPNAVAATTGGETYTIAGGAVTQISGTTVDGQSPAIGDFILIKNAPAATGAGAGAGTANTTQPANGLYVVNNNTTNLTVARANMADTATEIKGMVAGVQQGTLNADTFWHLITDTITLNTTGLLFDYFNIASIPQATTALAGKSRMATQAEAEAKALGAVALTPASVVNFAHRKSFLFGNGSLTTFTIAHGYGHANVVPMFKKVSNNEVWDFGYTVDATNVVIDTAIVPTSNEFTMITLG